MIFRLQKKGLRVLVERPVHRTEFPEYEAFDPEEDGKAFNAVQSVTTWLC